MYTRSYPQEKSGIMIPESYGGTALREEDLHSDTDIFESRESVGKNPWENESTAPNTESAATSAPPTFSFLSRLPIGGLFKDFFNFDTFSLQKIGAEEILIIATAAFLFFTKDGDKECALMLLLLLLIPSK